MLPAKSNLRTKRFQILATVLCVVVLGALQIHTALNPDPRDRQAVIDVTYHLFASALGSVFPLIVMAPIGYWISGRIFRRFEARR
jgi:hypothetical protein